MSEIGQGFPAVTVIVLALVAAASGFIALFLLCQQQETPQPDSHEAQTKKKKRIQNVSVPPTKPPAKPLQPAAPEPDVEEENAEAKKKKRKKKKKQDSQDADEDVVEEIAADKKAMPRSLDQELASIQSLMQQSTDGEVQDGWQEVSKKKTNPAEPLDEEKGQSDPLKRKKVLSLMRQKASIIKRMKTLEEELAAGNVAGHNRATEEQKRLEARANLLEALESVNARLQVLLPQRASENDAETWEEEGDVLEEAGEAEEWNEEEYADIWTADDWWYWQGTADGWENTGDWEEDWEGSWKDVSSASWYGAYTDRAPARLRRRHAAARAAAWWEADDSWAGESSAWVGQEDRSWPSQDSYQKRRKGSGRSRNEKAEAQGGGRWDALSFDASQEQSANPEGEPEQAELRQNGSGKGKGRGKGKGKRKSKHGDRKPQRASTPDARSELGEDASEAVREAAPTGAAADEAPQSFPRKASRTKKGESWGDAESSEEDADILANARARRTLMAALGR